jgi:hypothetical protein
MTSYPSVLLVPGVECDVGPPRLHAAGLVVVLHVHPELEVVGVAGDHPGAEPLLAVDVHGHRRRADVVDDVEPEPPVVDAGLHRRPAVEAQDAVVDVQHQHGGVRGALLVVDLHHRHAGGPRRHVAVALELPHPRRVVVALHANRSRGCDRSDWWWCDGDAMADELLAWNAAGRS